LAESDPQQALAYAHRARQLVPKDPAVADTLGWVYVKLNQPDQALEVLRDLVRDNPERGAFRYHLAAALELQGKREAARSEAEQALKGAHSKDDERQIKELLARLK